MTYVAALEEAKILKDFLEKQGVAVSIELVESTRKIYNWLVPPGNFRVEMSHHIVSSRAQGLTPFLDLVKRGRVDVKGPLANGYGGWDEVYRIITMGVANHSGRGGPLTVDNYTVPLDAAAYVAWGTEFEGGLYESDWNKSYRLFMSASCAGVLDYMKYRNSSVTDAAHCEHSTWTTRKQDRLGYTRTKGIIEIADWRRDRTIGAEDMTEEEYGKLLSEVGKTRAKVEWMSQILGFGTVATPFYGINQRLEALAKAVAALTPGVPGETPGQVGIAGKYTVTVEPTE